MSLLVLSAPEFYASVARYMNQVDPRWAEEDWQAQVVKERTALSRALGEGAGRSVLDCSCGSGAQAIPLALAGWRVTATDIAEASLVAARRQADAHGVAIDVHTCDMRDLGQHFRAAFDWVVSCMALDNIIADDDFHAALRSMRAVLRPGGKCYLRLRDFDHLMRVRPRYDMREERVVPHGRVIRLEDWEYESDMQVVCRYVFLREDMRRDGYRWQTDVFSYRRRALRKGELERCLRAAGFRHVALLPQPSPWAPYEAVASTGTRD